MYFSELERISMKAIVNLIISSTIKQPNKINTIFWLKHII